MKTIFITSFHPFISRNILRTGVLEILSKRARIVILTYDYKADYFQKEFAREGVIIETIPETPLNAAEKFLKKFETSLLPTSTIFMKKRAKFRSGGKLAEFLLSVFFLKIIARLPFIPEIYRAFFALLYRRDIFGYLFKKYGPDLVFSTDVLDKNDIRIMAESKMRGVKTIGMVRSWDNLTNKGLLPVFPHKFIANNEIVRDELINFNNARKEDIAVVGMPQFDYYIDYQPTERKKFFEKLSFDENKKIIMFAPMGSKFISSDWLMLQLLHDAILEGRIEGNPNLLVRFPPGDGIANLGSVRLSPKVKVFLDRPGIRFSSKKKKDNEMGLQDMIHLADSLFYSSLLINAGSSLCIDIAAFDRPIIFPAFDGNGNIDYFKSVKKLFAYHHYQYLLRTKACRIVHNKDELISWINTYLLHPEIDREKRARLLQEQCWRYDGKAADRTATTVLRMLQ